MTSKIKIPEEISGLFHEYNDKFLVDDSLSDMDVFLLTIYIIEKESSKSGVEYNRVREAFSLLGRKYKPNFLVAVHNAQKLGLIEQKNKVFYFLIKGLKKIRDVVGQIGEAPVHIIKSGKNFEAIKLFEDFLHNEIKGGEIKICDSHISSSTLMPFSDLKLKKIRIITSKIHDKEKFDEYAQKMLKQEISIEVKENDKIHDRFILNNNKCWNIGASIKDLGNKDTIIKEISEVFDSMNSLFEERWKE